MRVTLRTSSCATTATGSPSGAKRRACPTYQRADGAVQRVFAPVRQSSISYREAGVIRRRPYQIVREATRAEFLKHLEEGNNITKAAILASSGRAADDAEA